MCSAVFLMLTVQHTAEAQRVVVRGTVTDGVTGLAVMGARATLGAGIRVAITDQLGRFALQRDAQDLDTLRVIRIGYRPVSLALHTVAHDLRVVMEPAPAVLQTVVSLATRRAQASADIALPVQVMEQEAVAASGALGLDALLSEIPGLQQSIEPPARSALQIRGIGGSRVLVLVDGEPVPGAMIEDRDLSRISLGSAERVELVKGPLSAIHGSEAIGGVINLVTRLPDGPLTARGQVSTGTNARRAAQLEVGAGGSLAWQVSVAHRSVEQLATQSPRPDARQRLWDARLTTRWEPTPALDIRWDASVLRERQRWPIDGTFNAFNDNRAVSSWAEAQHQTGAQVWRVRASFQDFSHRYREAAGDRPFADTGTPAQRERSGRLLLTTTRPLGRQHLLDAGVEAMMRRVHAPDRLVGGTLDDRSVDLWLQDTWHAGQWMMTLAGRQGFSSRWGATFTPAVTIAVEPGAALRLHGSVGRGFRGPSFKESGWSFSNASAGYLVEGNPDLVPEHSWQVSVGGAWQPTSDTRFQADLFRNMLRDLIDLRLVGTNPAGLLRYRPTNVARASTQGAEVEVQHAFDQARLSLTWAWLASRDATTGAPLPERIPHTLRLGATALAGPLDLTLTGSWRSRLRANGGSPARDAFLAWDASLRWGLIGGVELRGGVDNVFDAAPAGWQGPIGRTLWVQATTTWRP